MKTKKLNRNSIINIFIFSLLIVTYTFGLLIPLTSDAGKYAAISRVIFESGDWINLNIHFEPYLQKPPLIFWITTPFYYLFGPSTFTFKLPVLLYSGIAIYSTYRFTKIFYNNKTAKLAALILGTSQFFFLFHNDVHCDCLLTANVIFSVWQLAEYFNSKKIINILFAGLGIGLALISKGPIGIFIPGIATLAHLILKKQLKLIFNYKIILGFLVIVAILVFGLKGIYNQFGWVGIRFFFWDNNAGRISGSLKGSSNDYFFYFHTALYIFLPWGLLFFITFISEIREFIKKKSAELYSLAAIIFFWIIISYARAKAPHYLMVLSPFMAIISAKWLYRYFHESSLAKYKKAVKITQNVTIIGTWILLIALCTYFFPAKNIIFWFSILILFPILFILKTNNKLNLIVRRTILTIIALNFALNVHVFPQLFTYQSVVPACKIFNSLANEGEILNTYLSEHRELFFYAKNPGYFLYNSEDLKNCLNKSGMWIFTNDKGLEEIKVLHAKIEIVQSFKHRSISKLTANFLNPATRKQSLKNMHLIKIF